MRLLLPALLIMLTGCPGPATEQTCQRGLVDAGGDVNGGFGGGPATANEPPIALVGSPLTVVVFAPLSSCISDTLRADVTLFDADNVTVTAEATEPTRTISGAVKVSVTFTPQRPGLHTLHVAFEPSLGARSRLIDVAVDGLRGATTRVPNPSVTGCGEALWPLSDDTVACEEKLAGVISLSSADGGQFSFPGERLVVVGEVLWTINGATSSLERRVVEDGGVRLTHSLPDFQSGDTPAMHDVDLALRYRSNGRLTLVRVSSQGETVRELNVGAARAYFTEDDDLPFLWSDQSCFSGCISLPDVVGLEPGFVWRSPNPRFELAPRLSGYARPTTESQSAPRFTLQYAAQTLEAPGAAFERLPLWLRSTVETKQLLVSTSQGSLSFSAWPRAEVLRVGRHHVLLTDPEPGMLRVVRMQEP